MVDFYEDWIDAHGQLQDEFHHAKHVARDRDIPWIKTRYDAKVKLMVDGNLGYATMGGNVLKAEIPVGWHTGKHAHGEESMHILRGEGFSIVDGQRFDWHKGTTLQIPYRAVHQHFNTGSEPAMYLAGMCFSLERFLKIAKMEHYQDCGPNDPAVLAEFPAQESEYYRDGPRAIIHLEDAPADYEFPGHNADPGSKNQHHYTKYLVAPENGFKATSVAVTHLWEEPAGTHSGKHSHLEAVVYAWQGRGRTDLNGIDEPWEEGDVLHVPPTMWEHMHYNDTDESYWQLRIQFGIRQWFEGIYPGYKRKRIMDEEGRPIEAGPIERDRERTRSV